MTLVNTLISLIILITLITLIILIILITLFALITRVALITRADALITRSHPLSPALTRVMQMLVLDEADRILDMGLVPGPFPTIKLWPLLAPMGPPYGTSLWHLPMVWTDVPMVWMDVPMIWTDVPMDGCPYGLDGCPYGSVV